MVKEKRKKPIGDHRKEGERSPMSRKKEAIKTGGRTSWNATFYFSVTLPSWQGGTMKKREKKEAPREPPKEIA